MDLITNDTTLGDYWGIDPGDVSTDPPTDRVRQRIASSTPITITEVEVCLGVSAPATGNMHFEIWNDTTAGCAGLQPYCPSTQSGGVSDDVDVSALPSMLGLPNGDCGTVGNGAKITVTWASNNPAPTGDFWIVGVDNDTGGITGGVVQWGASAGNTPNTYADTDFDVWKDNTDNNNDAYFIVRGN